MFENMKERVSARDKLNTINERITEAEAQLQELTAKLDEARVELEAREETISKKDDIIIAIHQQVTAERENILSQYAEQEEKAVEQLERTQSRLKHAKTHYEDCERQVYCMANLYKAMRASIKKYNASAVPSDLAMSEEELEELDLMEEAVGLKMHSYKIEELHKLHEVNNKLLEQLIVRYQNKMIVPADRVAFQLMSLAVRAELQQIIDEMDYGGLNRACVRLHLVIGKYLKVISASDMDKTNDFAAYAGELEVLLKETLRLEHEFYARKTDFVRHEQLFGDPEKNDDGDEEPESTEAAE